MKSGDTIDSKYRIETQLGEGGMGLVLAATHVELGSTVAIKVLKKDALSHPEVPVRFMREARAASRLRNEHVVRVTDVGRLASGEPFMVMEMLHGHDLATRLTRGALEPARAVEYIVQACEGLAEAHGLGMVHRDVKPANLFVTQRPNGTPLVKVLDFGIATAAIGDVDHRLTTTQSVIGSPSYMSPEQLRATRDVDARSDIWSLGVTLYELLADRQPFIAPTITALSLKIVSDPHPPIDEIPAELMAVIDRCLEKDREKRYASVAELADALAPFSPNGKIAAEMVSGALSQPVPPTLHDEPEPPDPSKAGWRIPSTPGISTTGFTAGESSPSVLPRRKKKTAWIALGASAIAGGLATAAILTFSGGSSSSPSAVTAPPTPVVQPAAALPAPTPPPPAPVAQPAAAPMPSPAPEPTPPPAADTKVLVEAKPVEPPAPKQRTKSSRRTRVKVDAKAGKTDKPTEPDDKPVDTKPFPDRRPDVTPPPKQPPPPPSKKLPCDPKDKTCGL